MYTIYRVSANKDQLEQAEMMSEVWIAANAKVPNRVSRDFYSFADADTVYRDLQQKKMVAFKNWMS